eukprot:5797338-Prymnesium_polylepis.1
MATKTASRAASKFKTTSSSTTLTVTHTPQIANWDRSRGAAVATRSVALKSVGILPHPHRLSSPPCMCQSVSAHVPRTRCMCLAKGIPKLEVVDMGIMCCCMKCDPCCLGKR